MTASRDKTIKIWVEESANTYTQLSTLVSVDMHACVHAALIDALDGLLLSSRVSLRGELTHRRPLCPRVPCVPHASMVAWPMLLAFPPAPPPPPPPRWATLITLGRSRTCLPASMRSCRRGRSSQVSVWGEGLGQAEGAWFAGALGP